MYGFIQWNFCVFAIPSKEIIARILSIVDGWEVGKLVIDLTKERLGSEGDVIDVDGKAIRSINKFKDKINSI